jgi:hypothetical protein
MSDIDFKKISREEVEELIEDYITDEENLKCFTWYLFNFCFYILLGFFISVVLGCVVRGVVYVTYVLFKFIGM